MFLKANQKWFWLLPAAALLLALCLAAACYAQGEVTIVVNGNQLVSDVPPQIIDGRTMAPLGALASALGFNVAWDAQSRTVSITQNNQNTQSTQNAQNTLNGLPILTVNGEQTTWPYWYVDGTLYMEYHDAIEILRMGYETTQVSIGYSTQNQVLTLNNAVLTVPYVQRGSFKTISMTYLSTDRGLINYKFDPQTGNMTLLPNTT